MRNALFAVHGRAFRTRWLRDLFRSKGWYREDPAFSPSRLTAGEKEAVQLLAELEEWRAGRPRLDLGSRIDVELSEERVEELRALGYVE